MCIFLFFSVSLSFHVCLSLFSSLSPFLQLTLHMSPSVSLPHVSLFSSLLSLLNALCVVCCCVVCGWAGRVVVVVAVDVAVCMCVRFFLSCNGKNASVCSLKTLPCVLSKRPRHIGHVKVHTEAFSMYTRARVGQSLPLFSCLSQTLLSVSLFSHTSLFFSLSAHLPFSSLSITFSITMTNDRFSSRLSLYTALTCLECQSAWALAHSLSVEHVRIMQETFVEGFSCAVRYTSLTTTISHDNNHHTSKHASRHGDTRECLNIPSGIG